MTYFKAIAPDGTDFRTGTVQWAPRSGPAQSGSVVRHPTARRVGYSAAEYLSASTVATDCTGMDWPCRLLEVEPVDESGHVIEPVSPDPRLPNKRAAIRWRIVRELDPALTLGPQGEQIVAFVERAGRLTEDEAFDLAVRHGETLHRAREATAWLCANLAFRDSLREAAWNAAHDSAFEALKGETWEAYPAIRNAVRALVVRRPHWSAWLHSEAL